MYIILNPNQCKNGPNGNKHSDEMKLDEKLNQLTSRIERYTIYTYVPKTTKSQQSTKRQRIDNKRDKNKENNICIKQERQR